MNLCDDFKMTGTSIGDFKAELDRLTEHTKLVNLESCELEIIPVCDPEELGLNEQEYEKAFLCVKLPQGHLFAGSRPQPFCLSQEQILKKGGSKELFDETRQSSRLLIKHDGIIYFTSPALIETLCGRAGMTGPAVKSRLIEKYIFLSRLLKDSVELNLLVRFHKGKQGVINKVFAVFSSQYAYISQNALNEVMDALDLNGAAASWTITHSLTEIHLEFPNRSVRISSDAGAVNKLVPGLILRNSDAGESSLTASATWRLNTGEYIEGDIIRRKHRGKPDLQPFCKSVQREIIDGFQKNMKINTARELPWSYAKKRIKIKCSAAFYEIVGKKKGRVLDDVQSVYLKGKEHIRQIDIVASHFRQLTDVELTASQKSKLRQHLYDVITEECNCSLEGDLSDVS